MSIIKEVLHQIMIEDDSTNESKFEQVMVLGEDNLFYKRINGQEQRYVAILSTKELQTPEYYNDVVLQQAPDEIKSSPAFEKNTDIIILFDLDHNDNFKDHEKAIFTIEENPYQFKKYVLYTTEEERQILTQNNGVEAFFTILKDETLFDEYKKQPYIASRYGLVAKFYIKIPFLKIPESNENISNVDDMLESGLNEDQKELSKKMDELISDDEANDWEQVIEDYLND